MNFLSAASVLAVVTLGMLRVATAQEPPDEVAEGYITSMSSAHTFTVEGVQVTVTAYTGFGREYDTQAHTNSPLRRRVRVGAYVEVMGRQDKRHHSAVARAILLRPDWDKKINGAGVINKVIADGAEPEFSADGYLIRITPKTKVSFKDSLKSLRDVHPNKWMQFKGVRGGDGVIRAGKVKFFTPKMPKSEPQKKKKKTKSKPDFCPPASGAGQKHDKNVCPQQAADASGQLGRLTQAGYIKLGIRRHKHEIPADNALQERVWRVGMRVVPENQKQLADDDPQKIHFRFYAFEDNKFNIIFGDGEGEDGLILVSVPLVKRLKSDDQLAAVLAYGVAANLQGQAEKMAPTNNLMIGVAAAELTASAFTPWPWSDILRGEGTINSSIANRQYDAMVLESARISLELMTDGGYDPWQAPEAWRLISKKKLPKDLSAFKYPPKAAYLFSVLGAQYPRTGDSVSSGGTH